MTHSHPSNLPEAVVDPYRREAPSDVGTRFRRADAYAALLHERFDGVDLELEIHIEDCQWQYLTSYERFELHRNPHDRDEALLHLHRMNTAILSRSPAVQAARHAQFERDLDEQVAYFQSEAALQLGRVG